MIKKPSQYALFLIFAWLTIIFTSDAIGKIEGFLFPVVSKLEYEVMNQDESESHAALKGQFEKYRNCSFNRIKWMLKDEEDLSVEVEVSFDKQVVIRKQGKQIFYNWKVYNYGVSLKNSDIYVYHNCHPLWVTITKM